MDEEVARSERVQSQCAILFLDIDHFKRVNDTWGHRAGDAILREVATRLQKTLRLSDVVGRYGGEEFALLLPETDIVGASETAERLRIAIAVHPCVWQSEDGSSNATIPITASIGVACYGMHGTTRERLVERADQAMYRAKQSGRNRVCVADLEEPVQENYPIIAGTPPQVEATAVQVLTAAAYARDRGTDDHAHRMVALAEATAREMYMEDEEIHLVRLGALLHDIGKIGIPDAILHKPGPLTSEEWDIMRMHPEIGQRILSQAGGVFISLANIVVAHHERWDGRGYPRALVGESIPLAARILTVIDSYDAMTSRRVYRNSMSPLAARVELQRCAGSQYDPAVVSAFLHVLDTHDILEPCLFQSHQRLP
jgi:diguanylate cyclase (GGDEF)-like protein/putative nucleotidyltransferase with HDIG domain